MIRFEKVNKKYGTTRRSIDINAEVSEGRGGGRVRPVRLGQVDADPHRQPARGDRVRRAHSSTGATCTAQMRQRRAQPAAQPHRLRVPELQPVPAPLGARERHALADEGERREARGRARRGRWRCSTASGSPPRPAPIRRSSPAASSSAWRSPARSRWSRPRCSSTSRRARSTPRWSARCWRSCAASPPRA